jgi:SAM-dependent methyltransferase
VCDAHPNYRFVVSQIRPLVGINAKALDYGCGRGEMVRLARAAGIDMVGADVFCEATSALEEVRHSEDFGRTIFKMEDGRLPFPDRSFDIVCSNQVFEHVQDLELALSEIHRVLKSGGVFLNLFPSIGVLREGHCGVPLAHWLNAVPAIQRAWLWAFCALGFGYFTAGKSCGEWAAGFSDYLRRFTHYRTRRAILSAYKAHFVGLRHRETQFAVYRLRLRGRHHAARLAARLHGLTAIATRRLGSMVIIARTA